MQAAVWAVHPTPGIPNPKTQLMSNLTLAEMIAGSFRELSEGSIVKGKILEIKPQVILVDIGYKSEGAIPSNEFEDEDIQVGDEVEVLLEKLENDEGMVVLSKEKAAHKQNWDKIASRCSATADSSKARSRAWSKAVSPSTSASKPSCPDQPDRHHPAEGSQRIRRQRLRVQDRQDQRRPQEHRALPPRSHRWQSAAEQRQKFLDSPSRLATRSSRQVKNITDFGAFVDLNGMDGLLHITDMSWGRINHPTELVHIGQESWMSIILDVDREKERVSLGLKQMPDNPWENIERKYPVGQRVKRQGHQARPYGAFVEIEEGVEGLVHVSELSWVKRIARPSDVLTVGQEIDASCSASTRTSRRSRLGVRQLDTNPWDDIDTPLSDRAP
jgi:small subunit ribosomal protein S1